MLDHLLPMNKTIKKNFLAVLNVTFHSSQISSVIFD